MTNEPLLICTVSEAGGQMVCACTHCGWVSAPAGTGAECGAFWDDHMACAHSSARVSTNA